LFINAEILISFSFSVLSLVQYNFEGRYDLVKFVRLAASHGLYFFLRIGPYACAEWNFGSQPFLILSLFDVSI